MSSRFWASSEDMSADSTFEEPNESSRDRHESDDGEPVLGISGRNEAIAAGLRAPSVRTVARVPASNSLLQARLPQQHMTRLLLSLIEDKCKTQAAKSLNRLRPLNDQLPEDHPEVRRKARAIFNDTRQILVESRMVPEEFADQNLSDLGQYMNSFDTILSNIAANQGDEGNQAIRALEGSMHSTGLGDDFSISFDQPNALVRWTDLNLAAQPQFAEQSLLDLLSRNSGLGRAQRSIYRTEYKQICVLGKGGFGCVFQAQHKSDKGIWAVKRIVIPAKQLRHLVQNNKLECVLKEVRVMALLNHPHIVRYHHCWFETAIPQATDIENSINSTMASQTLDETTRSRVLSVNLSRANLIEFGNSNSESEDTNNGAGQSFDSISGDNIEFGYSDSGSNPNTNNNDSISQNPPNEDQGHIQFGYSSSNGTTNVRTRSRKEDSSVDTEDVPRALIQSQPSINFDAHIYIKMSSYPLSLEDLLWPEQQKCPAHCRITHCYHAMPSLLLFQGLLDGLEYLHARNLLHRDLKPGNIFLEKLGERDKPRQGYVDMSSCPSCSPNPMQSPKLWACPCIGDFGLATLLDDDSNETPSSNRSKDSSKNSKKNHEPPGTKLYLPKVLDYICPKLDIYALGVVLIELVYKFSTKGERIHVLSQFRDESVLPDDFELKVETGVVEGIRGMCCPDREKRWGLDEVRNWLEELLTGN